MYLLLRMDKEKNQIYFLKFYYRLASGSNTVVEHSTPDPQIMGSSPANCRSAEKVENLEKKILQQCFLFFCFDFVFSFTFSALGDAAAKQNLVPMLKYCFPSSLMLGIRGRLAEQKLKLSCSFRCDQNHTKQCCEMFTLCCAAYVGPKCSSNQPLLSPKCVTKSTPIKCVTCSQFVVLLTPDLHVHQTGPNCHLVDQKLELSCSFRCDQSIPSNADSCMCCLCQTYIFIQLALTVNLLIKSLSLAAAFGVTKFIT